MTSRCPADISPSHFLPFLGFIFLCFLFLFLLFIMASFCLQVLLVSLAAFCCCSEGASSCNLTFSGIAWPPALLAVDLKDVNTSFFNISPNGTVSYKGRPFFFRVTNVFGGSPSPRSDNILLKLRSRERAIFFSLFEGLPYAEDVAIMALGHLHFSVGCWSVLY